MKLGRYVVLGVAVKLQHIGANMLRRILNSVYVVRNHGRILYKETAKSNLYFRKLLETV